MIPNDRPDDAERASGETRDVPEVLPEASPDAPSEAQGAARGEAQAAELPVAPDALPPADEEHVDGPPTRLERAMAIGALAAIATGGAMIGLGMREGEAGRAFRLVGRTILERIGVASASAPLTSVALGYLHHLVIATAWGTLLGLLVLPLRGTSRVLAAIGAAVLYALLALWVVTPVLRIGYSVTANVPGVVAIAVALSVALLGGVWLAATDTRE